ncbi:uncharacterized protein LAJ45_05566 [Morchella importuna]|uniref:Twinfilin n=1 Tax=Morchella conica CCBAS932 TaxID=1392247 RepID=A0A3N4KTX7_9PEZI|nr:uncharacterized protein LAJ45_05566 [Morchella importuna]KAH8150355.1 hypothetical protein LAJ45_05566 [Morchella importuna]RPB13967.1 actin depolymerizing protein [Morchella conica CCBAS932]
MQSGITASAELLSTFQNIVSTPSLRGLIVSIEKETLVPRELLLSTGSFESDLSQLDALLKDNEAAYIILRRREDPDPAPFISIAYVPDSANVRQKMLFASTRNTLLRELGTERFGESIFATVKEELTAEGFKRHDAHEAKPAPLTEEEMTMAAVKEAEYEASTSTSARKSHVSSGIKFPVSQEAIEALTNLPGGFITLVQLAINNEKETIELANASSSAINDFTHVIPDDAPRYSFFRFNHTHEGQQESPIVFIYTCPTSSKIREKMLYASCRSSVVNAAINEAHLNIEKKLEAASATEIGEAQLLEEFHPKVEQKASFKRPARPGRR